MVDERRREGDAALAVELALEGATEDEALERATLARERVEPLGLRASRSRPRQRAARP